MDLRRRIPIYYSKSVILLILLLVHIILLLIVEHIEKRIEIEKIFTLEEPTESFYNDIFFIVIYIGFIIPIIEEISFRFWLNNNIRSIFFSSVIFIIYLFLIVDKILLLPLLFIYFTHIIIWVNNKNCNVVMIIVLAMNSLLFAGLHLINFRYNELLENLYLVPILILPQLLLGIITFITRIKFGFLYCTLYHILYNIILLVIGYWEFIYE